MKGGSRESEAPVKGKSSKRIWTIDTDCHSLLPWIDSYIALVIAPFHGDRGASQELSRLLKFAIFLQDPSITSLQKDVLSRWEGALLEEFKDTTAAAFTESARRFLTWVTGVAPGLIEVSNTPRSAPRAITSPLTINQVRAIKETAKRRVLEGPSGERPCRDRAILLFLLELGLGREELIGVKRGAVDAYTPEALFGFADNEDAYLTLLDTKRKGLSRELRHALVEYILLERPRDGGTDDLDQPLFLSVGTRPRRSSSGGLSLRAINLLLEGLLGKHNEQEMSEETRIASLTPRILRRTYDEYYSR